MLYRRRRSCIARPGLRDDPETRSEMAGVLEAYREANSMDRIAEHHRTVYAIEENR